MRREREHPPCLLRSRRTPSRRPLRGCAAPDVCVRVVHRGLLLSRGGLYYVLQTNSAYSTALPSPHPPSLCVVDWWVWYVRDLSGGDDNVAAAGYVWLFVRDGVAAGAGAGKRVTTRLRVMEKDVGGTYGRQMARLSATARAAQCTPCGHPSFAVGARCRTRACELTISVFIAEPSAVST